MLENNNEQKQKLILEINKDQNLTSEEKKSKIKDIMMGKYKDQQKILIKCTHYVKSCDQFYFSCCNETYDCCRCHNQDGKCKLKPIVKSIVCTKCKTCQDPTNNCTNCFIKFSRNHCQICNIWSEKNIFHCESCGICRIGEKNKYFHCNTCQGCFKIAKENQPSHQCPLNNIYNFSTTTQCLLCLENASTSQCKLTYLDKCKHPVHSECLKESLKNGNYKCPLCRKSMINMNNYWNLIKTEINLHPLPEEIKKKVNILCNDCENKTENTEWHFLGSQCQHCNSYNTVNL